MSSRAGTDIADAASVEGGVAAQPAACTCLAACGVIAAAE
jgi:hypothetical protein